MSKGWESKNVEEQQAEASAAKKPDGDPNVARAVAERKRRLQALELQREHVLSQRTSSPHRRSALEAALVEIELEIQKLGNAIHI
jgi:hypothetical protein